MNNLMTEYLTAKVADDMTLCSTTLAIREVLATKCRYRALLIIGIRVTWGCVPELYPKIRHCSNKCYKCGNGKLLVEVR